MIISKTKLKDVFEIQNKRLCDSRGSFVKTFHQEKFEEMGLDSSFKESFYSSSTQGVLRGMHFQLPPYDHSKLVQVVEGEILDVVVDIRLDSPTFGEYFSTNLSADNVKSLYIGKGYAHGFLTLSKSATVIYMTTTVHAPSYDTGICWDSFGFNWNIKSPILSARDESFVNIQNLTN